MSFFQFCDVLEFLGVSCQSFRVEMFTCAHLQMGKLACVDVGQVKRHERLFIHAVRSVQLSVELVDLTVGEDREFCISDIEIPDQLIGVIQAQGLTNFLALDEEVEVIT